MKIEFNSLYWDNTSEKIVSSHKKVLSYFNIPVNYYAENTNHGLWMDRVCAQSTSDVIGFFDSDCVPLNRDKILECINYVASNDTFLGVTQVSNHIPPRSHIYAAPAFYLITKNCWQKLNTSFTETRRSDVGEELTYKAELIGKRYRCLYPTSFEAEPAEGVWPLGNYGYYGIGTVFDNTVYHLYQARLGQNIERFVNTCDSIVNGTFSTDNSYSARTYSYKGRVVQ